MVFLWLQHIASSVFDDLVREASQYSDFVLKLKRTILVPVFLSTGQTMWCTGFSSNRAGSGEWVRLKTK